MTSKAHERKEKLEQQVIDLTFENFGLHTAEGIEELAKNIVNRFKLQNQPQRLSCTEIELKRLQTEVNKATEALIQNPTLKSIARKIEEQEKRIEELEAQLEIEKKQIKKEPTVAEVASWLKKCFGSAEGGSTTLTDKAKQKLIDLLVNHIVVDDDRLVIIYNIVPNTPVVPYEEIKEAVKTNIPTEKSVGISKLLAPPTGLEPVTP